MKSRFTSHAEAELVAAIDYYETNEPGLGADFLREVEETKRQIEMFPLAWTPMSKRTRKCRIHRFPFGLLYEVRPDEIVIMAVMDLRRDPTRWEDFLL